jgi:hypothetical protein
MDKITKENFNYDSVVALINKVGDSEIVKREQNGYVIIETKSVKPFQELFVYGKDNAWWCFCHKKKKCSKSAAEYYYDYVTRHNGKQFILFDFSKKYPNPKSVVAFTIWDDKVSHAYTLDNNMCDRKFYNTSLEEFMNLVLNN